MASTDTDRTKKLRTAGIIAFLVAVGVGLALYEGPQGTQKKDKTPAPGAFAGVAATKPPTFRLVKGELRIDPLRLGINVPEGWTLAKDAPPTGPTAELVNTEGAKLTAASSPRAGSTGAPLKEMLGQKQKEFGDAGVERSETTEEMIGGFRTNALAYTVLSDGGATRYKIWMIPNETYWLSFTCEARVDQFIYAETACRGVIDSFHTQL